MADGRIDIDTRLDPKGFNDGMDGILSEAQKGVKYTMAEMSDAWQSMGADVKMEVIAKTIEKAGEAWNTWDVQKQNSAIVETMNEVMNLKGGVEGVKNETKELSNEAENGKTAWGGILQGVNRIALALFPPLRRLERVKRGVDEIGSSSVKAFGEMTVGAGISSVAVGTLVATIGAIAVALIIVIAIIAVVAAAVAAFTMGAIMGFKSMVDQMAGVVSTTNQYGADIAMVKSLFADLQGAVYSAFSPLFYAALPWIKQLISWLIEAINLVAMIIAKLTGQSTYQKYVAGSMDKTASSADKAAGATGRLAKETEKAKGAAEGALAAFDQINVLQQETADTASQPSGGGMGAVGGLTGGTGEFVTAVVDDAAINAQWENVKAGFLALLNDLWTLFLDWVTNSLIPGVGTGGLEIMFWFVGTFIPRMVEHFINLVNVIIGWIKWGINFWINLFLGFVSWIYTFFIVPAWLLFRTWVGDICIEIQKIVNYFVEKVMTPFMTNVTKFCDDTLAAFTTTWNGIGELVKRVINGIIDLINGMLNGIQSGVNSMINSINAALIGVPGFDMISNVYFHDIPRLAKGAVIPPNSQFLAMLGDQRSGRNIEAPEALIRQIVREETEGMGAKDVNVNFTGTMGELIRVLKPEITRETYRLGPNLIDGATA